MFVLFIAICCCDPSSGRHLKDHQL
jgi:hypothetical protein